MNTAFLNTLSTEELTLMANSLGGTKKELKLFKRIAEVKASRRQAEIAASWDAVKAYRKSKGLGPKRRKPSKIRMVRGGSCSPR